jgi:cell division protein FtsL
MLATDVIGEKLEWMFYTIVCFLVMVMFKLWGWNQMDKNAVLREVKRLEYQVSLLKQQQK